MRGLSITALAASTTLSLGFVLLAPGARADDGEAGDLRSLPQPKPSWWSGWSGNKPKPEAKKVVVDLGPVPTKPITPDPATIQDREERALHRRNEVCYVLLDIAMRTNDDALYEKANQLLERANEVYLQRTNSGSARMTALPTEDVSAQAGPTIPAVREIKP